MLQLSLPKWTAETGLNAAAEALVVNHMPLARKHARGYAARYSIERNELEGAAFFGLMEAAKRYDAERGFAFATYALPWIKSKLNEHVLANVGPMRIGSRPGEKTAFFRLHWVKSRLGIYDNGDLSADDARKIGRILGISEADVVEANRRRAAPVRLDAPVNQGAGAELSVEFERELVEANQLAWRKGLLQAAMATLNERERAIVEGRHGEGDPAPLATFAERFGISVERVRQIEAKALDKVGKHMRGNTACSRSTAEATRLPPPKDELVTRDQPEGTVKVTLRHAVTGQFGYVDPIPDEFDARMRVRITRSQKRAQAERAERRAWRMRAIAAGLSWAVRQ
ncbi:sigma-70 family RNA polymerase sigma factor [Acidiphilium multivorum]|uniref:sigma-70 family RNA polymerase sigma factor n=1 Tax=Acidiphilium multivorum TaxID=62140 RepID=UPI001F4BDA90|nr:sigma-70 family RNA polymerase sigma factor [Acidiphilium multivorum]UNC15596.1 sigma-70 family RNA polymerase sigma factor [Acidiphilium multivorum]